MNQPMPIKTQKVVLVCKCGRRREGLVTVKTQTATFYCPKCNAMSMVNRPKSDTSGVNDEWK